MSESKHTPGPWRVERDTTLVWGACDPDDKTTYGMGYPVTEAKLILRRPQKRHEDEAMANARLIAAAPDLFEALKELVNWWENDGGDLNVSLATARAAIAKAT